MKRDRSRRSSTMAEEARVTRRCDNRADGRRARGASHWSGPLGPPSPLQIASPWAIRAQDERSEMPADPLAAIVRATAAGRPVRSRVDSSDRQPRASGSLRRQRESGRDQPRAFRQSAVRLFRWISSRPRQNAARRIRTCNQGIQGPSRFHEAWTISSSSRRLRSGSSRYER